MLPIHDKFAFVRAMAILSAAVALTGDHLWVARIIGVHDVVTERTGGTLVGYIRELTEQAESEARACLDPESWAEAYAIGRNSTIDALIEDIDGVSA